MVHWGPKSRLTIYELSEKLHGTIISKECGQIIGEGGWLKVIIAKKYQKKGKNTKAKEIYAKISCDKTEAKDLLNNKKVFSELLN